MESTYKLVELIGTSSKSWEQAAQNALTAATKSLRDIRVAEVVNQDLKLDDENGFTYRTKLRVSFKVEV